MSSFGNLNLAAFGAASASGSGAFPSLWYDVHERTRSPGAAVPEETALAERIGSDFLEGIERK